MSSSTATVESTSVSAPSNRKSRTRYIAPVVRVLMGAFLLFTGLNGLFNFLPPPDVKLAPGAAAFAGALMNTGYMMQLIAITQTIVGACFLANRFVPLALALFAPFIVNSMGFHLYLERSGLPMASVFFIAELYLAWHYRKAFAPMLVAKI
jgi:hypothetical protein